MTRTIQTAEFRNIFIAFLFTTTAFFVFASSALADEDTQASVKNSNQSNISSLEARLKSLTEMKIRLEALLAKLRNGSTSSNGSSNTPTNTTTNPTIPAGIATSTLKILEPNGGGGYIWDPEQRFGTLQKVRFTAPKGMTSVDIYLQKYPTAATHDKSAQGTTFYFMKGKDKTYPGVAHLGTVKLSGKGGTQKGFLWRASAVPSDGYKIVIVGKVDGVTYVDSSDATFSMTHVTDLGVGGKGGGPGQR